MAWTKRDIVRQAYAEIGKADYDFDLQPEDFRYALRSLDAMAATWSLRGIRISYAGGDGSGDVDADAEVPEFAHEALFLNLAKRLAPGLGKTVSPDTNTAAKQALSAVMAASMRVQPRVLHGYAGSGGIMTNLPRAPDDLEAGPSGTFEFGRAG